MNQYISYFLQTFHNNQYVVTTAIEDLLSYYCWRIFLATLSYKMR